MCLRFCICFYCIKNIQNLTSKIKIARTCRNKCRTIFIPSFDVSYFLHDFPKTFSNRSEYYSWNFIDKITRNKDKDCWAQTGPSEKWYDNHWLNLVTRKTNISPVVHVQFSLTITKLYWSASFSLKGERSNFVSRFLMGINFSLK